MDTNITEKTPKMKPYDEMQWERWSMYDTMPYVWNPDSNADNALKYISGNVIKCYHLLTDKPYEIKHE